jgi:hypothetical protein
MSVLAPILQGAAALAGAVILRLAGDEILGRWQQHIETKVEAVIASLSEETRAEKADDWRSARDALARRPMSMAFWARRFRHTVSERRADSTVLAILAKIESNDIFIVVAVIVAVVVTVIVPTVAVIAVVVNAVGVGVVVGIGSALDSAVSGAVGSVIGSSVDNFVGSVVGVSISGAVGGAAVVYAVVLVYSFAQLLVLSVEQLLVVTAGYLTGLLRLRGAGEGNQ